MLPPYAGMIRVRLKGRCGITHPLSPLAQTPLDSDFVYYTLLARKRQAFNAALTCRQNPPAACAVDKHITLPHLLGDHRGLFYTADSAAIAFKQRHWATLLAGA
jgi:hypothetical protein